MKCPNCGREIGSDNQPVYCLKLVLAANLLLPQVHKATKKLVIIEWVHEGWRNGEKVFWSSDFYCSVECFQNDISSIFASLRKYLENEEFVVKELLKFQREGAQPYSNIR